MADQGDQLQDTAMPGGVWALHDAHVHCLILCHHALTTPATGAVEFGVLVALMAMHGHCSGLESRRELQREGC